MPDVSPNRRVRRESNWTHSQQSGHRPQDPTSTHPSVRASTIVLLFGAVLFVLPVPGTFVAGALVILAGVAARLLGS